MLNRYTHSPTWMLVVGPGLAMLVSTVVLIIVAWGLMPAGAPTGALAGACLLLPFIPYMILACIRLRGLLRGYDIIESAQGGVQGSQRQAIDN
jgi:hypothetical protein